MPGLRLQFPAGRYHATPWGSHVNEGQVEWPPSPWRVLRALVASGFTTQQWESIPETAASLFAKLAGCLPAYHLPPAYVAHSRHYMPLGVLERGREKTTLVFDTWLDVGRQPLEIYWDCELSPAEFAQLSMLATGLGYLGRSESWVEAEAIDGAGRLEPNSSPHREGMYPGPGSEQVSLLAPVSSQEYIQWRREATERLLAAFPLPEGKKKPPAKLVKSRAHAVAAYPGGLLDCLMKDTSWWKGHGWSRPPGTQRVIYWRGRDAITVGAPTAPRSPEAPAVEAMLLGMTTPSGNRSSLPPCARTLQRAETLHRSIVSVLGRGRKVDCAEITGRDKNGKPLCGPHEHAHILPLDLDGDKRLDHFLIYAPKRLSGPAQDAIRGVRRTWTKGNPNDLQLAVAGVGNLGMLRSLPDPLGKKLGRILGPPGGARVWTSLTPFVPPRFLKKSGANSLAEQIRAELESRKIPPAIEVAFLPATPETLPLRHYVVRRSSGKMPPPVELRLAVRLRFAEPVQGPISLGYGSHFGLGLFAAVEE